MSTKTVSRRQFVKVAAVAAAAAAIPSIQVSPLTNHHPLTKPTTGRNQTEFRMKCRTR